MDRERETLRVVLQIHGRRYKHSGSKNRKERKSASGEKQKLYVKAESVMRQALPN